MRYLIRIFRALWVRRYYVFALCPLSKLIELWYKRCGRHLNNLSCFDFLHSNISFSGFLRNSILLKAEDYLNDIYDLFGSGKVNLVSNKWCQDFKTRYIWKSGKAYFRYKIINYETESDVKFAWDMSRCHHFLILGQAYKQIKNKKYAEKIKDDILDFTKENPFMHSINWTCAMDVAIRAANWIHALALIKESGVLEDKLFVRAVEVSLNEHRFFIEKNLEKGKPYSGNHYIADLAGLLHIYLIFDIRGAKWKKFLTEFQDEIRQQVLPSGFHYEKSTSYHKLVFEMVLYTYLILNENGVQFDGDVVEKIKSMANFMNNIIQPDGNIPFIGDNDNGCFLPFIHKGYANGTEIMRIAKKVFPKDDFTTQRTSFYDDANFAVLRKEDLFATIHNNPISRYSNGEYNQLYNSHTHCDMLSFTFSDGNQNIIVDPGTYCYTSSPVLRKKFRSTAKHNTVCINGIDQQKQNAKNLFSLTQYSFPQQTRMRDKNTFEGAYDFIDNGNVVYSHKRILELEDCCCVVDDEVKCKGEMTAMSYFYLSVDVTAEKDGDKIVILSKNRRYEMIVNANIPYNVAIQPCEIAPCYGTLLKSSVLVVSFDGINSCLNCRVLIKKI